MAIQREIFLYEVLLRFGPEGFVGAHVVDLERIADGDDVISDRQLAARPVTIEEVGAYLEDRNAELVVAAEKAREEAAAATARADAAQSRFDAIVARAAALNESLQAVLNEGIGA